MERQRPTRLRNTPAKRKKKKMEFSKRILVGVTIGTVIVTIFTLALAWRTQDTSILAYLIPAVFAELATATGFYFRKAERENTKGGIVYDSAMAQRKNGENQQDDASG